MVLKKLISFFSNLIVPGGQPRSTKAVPSYELIASDVQQKAKAGASSSLGSTSLAEDNESELCCVCLSGVNEGAREDCHVLPCLHKFHGACINRWLSGCSKTCPMCRFSVKNEDDKFRFRDELTEEMVIWFSSFHVAGF
ncbi:probable E3 ubiquitin-protein ligase ATL45 [Mangifera indica]|uniref:probable E3 ubiquitin-protein ligase ATL45 n=1 Tax=Mangifera indica TaxID=29780 RepID=UPI001CFB581E|nr:probable E3 ubiquitin-protein ligase ATL45 [Mangifera indica]